MTFLTSDSSTVSSASSSLDGDADTSQRRFKNDKLQRRLKLSNELRDVYDMLQRMNENDVSGDATVTSDRMKFKGPIASHQKQFNNFMEQNQVCFFYKRILIHGALRQPYYFQEQPKAK